ncbi:hypothetical protein ACOME3_002268 [Neoechinorhynchus agilis]
MSQSNVAVVAVTTVVNLIDSDSNPIHNIGQWKTESPIRYELPYRMERDIFGVLVSTILRLFDVSPVNELNKLHYQAKETCIQIDGPNHANPCQSNLCSIGDVVRYHIQMNQTNSTQHSETMKTHVSELERLISTGVFIPIEQVGNRFTLGYTPVYGVPIRSSREVDCCTVSLPPSVSVQNSECVKSGISLSGKPLPPKAPCANRPIGYMREAPNPTLELRNAGGFSKDRLVSQLIAKYEPRGGRGVSMDASSAACINEMKETPATQATLKAETTAERGPQSSSQATYTADTTAVREPHYSVSAAVANPSTGNCNIASAVLAPTPSERQLLHYRRPLLPGLLCPRPSCHSLPVILLTGKLLVSVVWLLVI